MANKLLEQMIADEVRRQLTTIRDQAKAYKGQDTTQSCTLTWSGHARVWPQEAVRERAHEAISGKMDKREIDELLLTVKFK